MSDNRLIKFVLLLAFFTFIKSDCASTVPKESDDCLLVKVDAGKQCCTKITTLSLTKLECVEFTDADAKIRTETEYTGYQYKCPIKIAPSPSGNTNGSSTTNNSVLAIITTPQLITDLDQFQRSCAAKNNPASKDECTGFKHNESNICCRITYKPFVTSSTRSYCMYYTAAEAKEVIDLGSKYYSYQCTSSHLYAFGALALLILSYSL